MMVLKLSNNKLINSTTDIKVTPFNQTGLSTFSYGLTTFDLRNTLVGLILLDSYLGIMPSAQTDAAWKVFCFRGVY